MTRTVQDVMTTSVIAADEQASFKELVSLIEEHRVSALPVLDEDGRVVGIVSEADLLLKQEELEPPDGLFVGRRRRIERRKAIGLVARDVMTRDVVAIRPNAPVAEAARVMHEQRVKRLPVIDRQGHLAGIVSRADVLKVFLRPDDEIRQEIVGRILGGMLWIGADNVDVRVRDGVVTLRGELEQRSTADVLTGLVRGVDGVVGVENRLGFRTDDVASRPAAVGPLGVYEEAAWRR